MQLNAFTDDHDHSLAKKLGTMIDPQARVGSYLKLMALVALMGLISALITFADLMLEFGKTGRFDYRHAPGIVTTAFVSLISGASLGPEAPLADACGGAGTWVSDKLRLDERETRSLGYSGVSAMLASFITNPLGGALLGLKSAQGGSAGLRLYFWVLFPSLLASAVSTSFFVMLTGSFFGRLYNFPAYSPRLTDLLLAGPLGLIGGLLVTRGLTIWLPFLQGALGTLLVIVLAGGSIAFQGGLFGGRKAATQAQAAPAGGSQAAKDDPSTPPTSST